MKLVKLFVCPKFFRHQHSCHAQAKCNQNISKPNEMSTHRIDFKMLTFFSIWSLLISDKYKRIHFVCFPKNFRVYLFPTILLCFLKKLSFFLPKISYIGGTDKIKNVFSMKSLNVLYAFSSTSYTESFKFENVMIGKAHS